MQSINNSFGVDNVAAISTAYRIDSLAITPIMYMSSAVSIFTGQNMGAKLPHRAKEGIKVGSIMSGVFALVVTLIFVTFGGFILSMFGLNETAVAIGWRFFRICAVFYPLMAIYNCFLGYLQGIKDVAFVAFVNISAMIVRILSSYFLMGYIGSDVIAVAECIYWTFGLTLCVFRFKAKNKTLAL